jgi:hypothetical protein
MPSWEISKAYVSVSPAAAGAGPVLSVGTAHVDTPAGATVDFAGIHSRTEFLACFDPLQNVARCARLIGTCTDRAKER